MQSETVKDRLITATMKLLGGGVSPREITARQIAVEASANLAMINYYFASKDSLVNIAVNKLISERADELRKIIKKYISPRDKLFEFLSSMCDIMLEFSDLTRPTIPFLMMESEIELPLYILPIISEFFAGSKTETECKIIAYQMVSFLQLIFYRSTDFFKYSGVDINDMEQRKFLLNTILNNNLGV